MSIKNVLSHLWASSFLYISVSTANQKQNDLVQKITLHKAYTFYFSPFVYIATASFNPITHEEFSGEGLPPQHYQHAAPPLPQNNTHACLLDRANYGRRDTHKGISYSTRSDLLKQEAICFNYIYTVIDFACMQCFRCF